MGLLAVWCEFAQTIFYYPALLGLVGSTLAYVIDPAPGHQRGLHRRGHHRPVLGQRARVLTRCVGSRQALLERDGDRDADSRSDPRRPRHHLPAAGQPLRSADERRTTSCRAWHGLASIVLVVNSFFTYAGVEINAVHVDELREPGREYPKSIFVAMGLVLADLHPPDAGHRVGDPRTQISFTAGVMQAFDSLFTHFGISFAVPLIAVTLAVGALAGMMAWLDGPSEGLLRIGREQGYLPPYFQKVNDQGIEVHILAAQGAMITIIALLYAFVPTISRAYWIFTAMATQVYLIMYVLMFIAAVRLRRTQPDHPRGYRAPRAGPAVPPRRCLLCHRVRDRVRRLRRSSATRARSSTGSCYLPGSS